MLKVISRGEGGSELGTFPSPKPYYRGRGEYEGISSRAYILW